VVEELSREDLTRVVDRAVEELLDVAKVTGPPVDAVALAARHLRLDLEERKPRGKAPRPDPTPEGKQWSAACAVGEHLRPDLLRRLGFDPAERRPLLGVSLADLVAERLLAPQAWFAADAAGYGYDLAALKDRYRTASHELLALRLLDLSEACVVTIVDDGSIYRRRSNAWRVRRELAEAEKECQRYVIEHDTPHRLRAGGWSVQGWPVPSPFGKRVILRSIVEDE
jgi:hypothetical protein